MKKFWEKNKDKIAEEFIKSVFYLIVAVIAVTFWEKAKIHNEISFSKKIDIFSTERLLLLENSERFAENYSDLSQFIIENGSAAYQSYTYNTNVTKIKRILVKTDLILINSMIENDSLKILHEQMNHEGQEFISELQNKNINNKRFAGISVLFDRITGMYGKEITKEIK